MFQHYNYGDVTGTSLFAQSLQAYTGSRRMVPTKSPLLRSSKEDSSHRFTVPIRVMLLSMELRQL
jgi:hypothetical protein